MSHFLKKLLNYSGTASSESPERIKKQYEIEKSLANRIRVSKREDRQGLYPLLYDELFKQVPYHSQLLEKKDKELRLKKVYRQMSLLQRFLTLDSVFLEIGAGDCCLALEVAKNVKKVLAIDVSKEITKDELLPNNFDLILSDGVNLPVPNNSVDIAYSRDLIEHLHPDDFREQAQIVFNKLVQNGLYLCITPNRLSGPHDISKYFDETATGFHIKEYTISELSETLKCAGFSHMKIYIGGNGLFLKFPIVPLKIFERCLMVLPYIARKNITHTLPVMALLGITLVATKSGNCDADASVN